jgi:hypothetical protein
MEAFAWSDPELHRGRENFSAARRGTAPARLRGNLLISLGKFGSAGFRVDLFLLSRANAGRCDTIRFFDVWERCCRELASKPFSALGWAKLFVSLSELQNGGLSRHFPARPVPARRAEARLRAMWPCQHRHAVAFRGLIASSAQSGTRRALVGGELSGVPADQRVAKLAINGAAANRGGPAHLCRV